MTVNRTDQDLGTGRVDVLVRVHPTAAADQDPGVEAADAATAFRLTRAVGPRAKSRLSPEIGNVAGNGRGLDAAVDSVSFFAAKTNFASFFPVFNATF